MNIKQKKILHLLSVTNGQRYSELYKEFNEEDKFPYHIKHLVSIGYVNKRNCRYYLTTEGAYATQSFEGSTFRDRKMSIPIYLFVCKYNNKYLVRKCFSGDAVSQHLYSLPGLKAEWGVNHKEMFTNILKVKLGIVGKVKYRSTFHLVEYTTKGTLIWDDIIFIMDVDVKEVLQQDSSLKWFAIKDIEKLPKKHIPLVEFVLKNNREIFGELVTHDNFNFKEEEL